MATRIANPLAMTNPPFLARLFGSPGWSWVWLLTRVWLGWHWLTSGWGKLANPAWTETGAALQGFFTRALAVNNGRPVIAYDWYRSFIRFLLDGGHYTWFAKLVAYGEVLVGVALVLGAFTGVAAFFGGFMNLNFMLAGTASTNPVMFLVSILLITAWRTAGWLGLDRWLLHEVGTPWQPGPVLSRLRVASRRAHSH